MISYIASGQDVGAIIKEDSLILQKAGVSHADVAQCLENMMALSRESMTTQINERIGIMRMPFRHMMKCPFDSQVYIFSDYYVCGSSNGNKVSHGPEDSTLISGITPHMLREHRFFMGDVPYAIKPDWAVELVGLVKQHGLYKQPVKLKDVYQTLK